MVKQEDTPDKLQARINEIRRFFRDNRRMPTFSEIGDLVGMRSKNAVFKLVDKLEALNIVIRDKKGTLLPGTLAQPVKMLGTVEAGFPSPAEEELVDTIS